jgi:hypothetical protein
MFLADRRQSHSRSHLAEVSHLVLQWHTLGTARQRNGTTQDLSQENPIPRELLQAIREPRPTKLPEHIVGAPTFSPYRSFLALRPWCPLLCQKFDTAERPPLTSHFSPFTFHFSRFPPAVQHSVGPTASFFQSKSDSLPRHEFGFSRCAARAGTHHRL